MSKTIETLNKIFDNHFIVDSPTTIEEVEAGMSCTLIKGRNIADEDMLVCRLDQENNPQVSEMFPYLRGNSVDHGLKGMKRICDYAIFVDKPNCLYVLLVEMKKGKESPNEQLDVTVPLIDFVFKRAQILNHLKNVKYIIRKIGITDIAGKRTTQMSKDIKYNEDHFVKLYKCKNLYLQRMLH